MLVSWRKTSNYFSPFYCYLLLKADQHQVIHTSHYCAAHVVQLCSGEFYLYVSKYTESYKYSKRNVNAPGFKVVLN